MKLKPLVCILVFAVCLLLVFVYLNLVDITRLTITGTGGIEREGFVPLTEYMKGIDMIYWINLDRSLERRNIMSDMFMEPEFADTPNTRFPAIDGKSADVFSFLDSSQKESPQLNNVEYACLLSHLEVIRTFSESSHKVALIMEDDMTMELRPHWQKSVEKIMEDAPKDWEVIQLCYIGAIPEAEFEPWFYHFSTGAYLINQKGANKLMQLMENKVYNLKKHPDPPYLHADSFIFSYLTTYCYKYPMFIYKDDNDSLLHNEHAEQHMESKVNILKMYGSM